MTPLAESRRRSLHQTAGWVTPGLTLSSRAQFREVGRRRGKTASPGATHTHTRVWSVPKGHCASRRAPWPRAQPRALGRRPSGGSRPALTGPGAKPLPLTLPTMTPSLTRLRRARQHHQLHRRTAYYASVETPSDWETSGPAALLLAVGVEGRMEAASDWLAAPASRRNASGRTRAGGPGSGRSERFRCVR